MDFSAQDCHFVANISDFNPQFDKRRVGRTLTVQDQAAKTDAHSNRSDDLSTTVHVSTIACFARFVDTNDQFLS